MSGLSKNETLAQALITLVRANQWGDYASTSAAGLSRLAPQFSRRNSGNPSAVERLEDLIATEMVCQIHIKMIDIKDQWWLFWSYRFLQFRIRSIQAPELAISFSIERD